MEVTKVSYVPLEVLKRVRVTCKKCEGRIEVELPELAARFTSGSCPLCGQSLGLEPARPSSMVKLEAAVKELGNLSKELTFDFPCQSTV